MDLINQDAVCLQIAKVLQRERYLACALQSARFQIKADIKRQAGPAGSVDNGSCGARGFHRSGKLRSCINVSGLCLGYVVLRAIMDISAHATL
jgi:hypothetical protein